MISRLFRIRSHSTDPYRNLALEEVLLRSVRKGQCILYLWQNADTVVLGRNQNAWAECDPAALKRSGGRLSRRLSGGGAVYHDTGNLNFTFLCRAEDSDRDRETQVILEAVRRLGVSADRTGRNDLVHDGRKFSGHAYYRSGDAVYHHGTIMLRVDMGRLSDVLRVSPVKLEKRGVASVRSRVMNLCEVAPDLTPDAMADALEETFPEVYGLPCEELPEDFADPEALDRAEKRYASREWIWGTKGPLPLHAEERFPEGVFRLDYETFVRQDGTAVFGQTVLSSDTLENDLDLTLADRLSGCVPDAGCVRRQLGTDAETDVGRILIRLTERIGGYQHV